MTDSEFQAAFDNHKDAIYRFAWRMSGPAAAADITQDVFVSLLRYPNRFDPVRGTLRAFLLGIARNLALKHWRAEHRFEPLDDAPQTRDAAQTRAFVAEPVDLERGEIGEIVGRAVRALRPLQREVVILAEYEGLTLAEIARAVDADVGTVKSRLHRARENLRRTLAPLRSRQPTTR
ncbi:MAG TPA: RNA polymerase sigma factor [Vicinamibacterales bacterium]|nr:RNA polymerase sigma factor [Vicinamibacterales bacterium]